MQPWAKSTTQKSMEGKKLKTLQHEQKATKRETEKGFKNLPQVPEVPAFCTRVKSKDGRDICTMLGKRVESTWNGHEESEREQETVD